MNRRAFLMTLGAALIPKIIRVTTSPVFDGTWATLTRSEVPMWRSVKFISTPTHPNNIFFGGAAGGGKSFISLHPTQLREYLKIGDPNKK
jgi:hypothetical protein